MILPEKSSGISLSCQTLRRSPSCPLFCRSSTCSLCHFHIPTLSDHSSSIPASQKSASHGKLHGDTLSNHNPSVGITQIRYGRRSIFLSACPTGSRCYYPLCRFSFVRAYLKNALRKMCVQFPATNKLPYHTPNVNYIPDRYLQEISLTCLKNNNFFLSEKNLDGFFL